MPSSVLVRRCRYQCLGEVAVISAGAALVLLELLERPGAVPGARDDRGLTAEDVAKSVHWSQGAKLLRDTSARLRRQEAARAQDETARREALRQTFLTGPLREALDLVSSGAVDALARDENGRTLLFDAAARQRESLEICRALVQERGADVRAASSGHQTALFESTIKLWRSLIYPDRYDG